MCQALSEKLAHSLEPAQQLYRPKSQCRFIQIRRYSCSREKRGDKQIRIPFKGRNTHSYRTVINSDAAQISSATGVLYSSLSNLLHTVRSAQIKHNRPFASSARSGHLGASPKKSLYLQIGIEPGQLIAVAWREAVDQVLGVAEVGQAVYGVIWARVVPDHLVLHHGIHAHGILPVTSGVEGAVAWVWRTRGVDGKWREHTHTHVR